MNLTVILGLPGPTEIILIILALLLLFGGRKIPELMKGIGQGLREFKKASKGDDVNESNPSGSIGEKSN